MTEVAVIVPVYKAESFLDRCVCSILGQTITALALILVDDGSPDQCPALCDAYAATEPRIHVLHQKNSGPSAARNRGIEWALVNTDCRYFVFIDSDDCVHPQYLERLLEAAKQQNADISMCRHRYITDADAAKPSARIENPVESKLVCAEQLMIQESSSFNYGWGKLFARRCFETLRFPEDVSFGEDNLTIYKAFFACERIAFFPEQLYYYYYTPTGITKSAWSPRSLQCFLGIREQLAFYAANGFPDAHHKEMELYIQQYAYQIHRIRADKLNKQRNKPYLLQMKREMRLLLKENTSFSLATNSYWNEALHPYCSYLKGVKKKLFRSLKKIGLRQTFYKIIRRMSGGTNNG